MLNLVQDKSIRLVKGNVEGLNQENVKIKIASILEILKKSLAEKKVKLEIRAKMKKYAK
jgi:hypothetical protein